MQLTLPLRDLVAGQQATNGIAVLPVTLAHVLALESLPPRHRDPFDRLLVAQAMVEGAVLVSVDTVFAAYPVTVLG